MQRGPEINGELTGGDEIGAVVLHVGQHETRAGEAGEDLPKVVFSTSIGSVRNVEGEGMEVEKRVNYVGSEFEVYRDNMDVITPWNAEGLISDWDVLQEIWDHALMRQLRIDPSDRPLLLAEPTDNVPAQREKLTEITFEKYRSPALFVSKEATLTSYASGRATSLVVDSGHSRTIVAAVHDGYVLNSSIQKSPLAGSYLNRILHKNICTDRGVELRPRHLFERRKLNNGKVEIRPVSRPGCTNSFNLYQTFKIVDDIKKVFTIPERPYDGSYVLPSLLTSDNL